MKSILYKDVLDIVLDFAGVEEVQLCDDVKIFRYCCDRCGRWRRRSMMIVKDMYFVYKTVSGDENHIIEVINKYRFWRLVLCVRCKRLYKHKKGISVKTRDLY